MTDNENPDPTIEVELPDDDENIDYVGMYESLVEEFGNEVVDPLIQMSLEGAAGNVVESLYKNREDLTQGDESE